MKLSRAVIAYFITIVSIPTSCPAQLSEVLMLTFSSSSQSDQTAIRFLPDATDSFDSQWDAYKFMNPCSTPNIYTVTDYKYAINTLNNNFTEKTIALYVKVCITSAVSITAEGTGEFTPSWSIVLIDNFLQKQINLRLFPIYNFESNDTDAENRFILKFTLDKNTITENVTEKTDLDKMVYVSDNNIIVSLKDPHSSICITDLAGNQLSQSEIQGYYSPTHSGIYLVIIISDKQYYSKKVFIE